MIDPRPSGHVHSVLTDPAGVDADPSIGEDVINHLVGDFIFSQVVISQGDDIVFATCVG